MTESIGAFGVQRSNGFVAETIRVLTRSRYNHAYIVISGNRVVGAQPHGASIASPPPAAEVSLGDELLAEIERRAPGRGLLIQREALLLVGTPYGFLDILDLGIRACGLNSAVINRQVARQDRLICSQLVDLAYCRAGVHLFNDGRLPQSVTPGDLADLLTRHDWSTITIDVQVAATKRADKTFAVE